MTKNRVYQVDDQSFIEAIKSSSNIHEALKKMGLNSRGAAYKTFRLRCKTLQIDTSHFIKDKELKKTLLENDIIQACTKSISRHETLKQLGLNPHSGGNVSWIDKQITNLKINTSHWLGMAHLKNKTHNWTEKIPLSEILTENSSYLWSSSLKKRLLKDGFLVYKCYHCGISMWLGTELSLQLEHKNGNNTDNRIENLCLLCPNCHSQTKTFAGRNIGRHGGT